LFLTRGTLAPFFLPLVLLGFSRRPGDVGSQRDDQVVDQVPTIVVRISVDRVQGPAMATRGFAIKGDQLASRKRRPLSKGTCEQIRAITALFKEKDRAKYVGASTVEALLSGRREILASPTEVGRTLD
jgi:hypothetical protein